MRIAITGASHVGGARTRRFRELGREALDPERPAALGSRAADRTRHPTPRRPP